jgi:hypothetical protein
MFAVLFLFPAIYKNFLKKFFWLFPVRKTRDKTRVSGVKNGKISLTAAGKAGQTTLSVVSLER